ncbi:ribulose-phosphate 3-epimerase [Treponema sp. OMZ 840]|uniref:ribulose-phosphate 3-epimerase n=1 Tax=Treponema sp. OMZ 840 TaxID=244313 RepID=UPI003D8BAAB7
MKKPLLAPSILSADFTDLASSFKKMEDGGAGWIHVDIMDGSFVPNISFGQPVVGALRSLTKLPFDVHLMINNPERHIESFAKAGADFLTFHWENVIHSHRLIEQIHALGKKAGVSIVPSTPVSALEALLPYTDLVLVMSVNPGFGGQQLIPLCLDKISALVRIREEKGYSYLVSVDGGVNGNNVEHVAQTGVDVIVSGSAFFDGTLQWEKHIK